MTRAGQGAVKRFAYRLQREIEPDVSGMGTVGETRRCGLLTSYNAITLDVSEMATAGQGG